MRLNDAVKTIVRRQDKNGGRLLDHFAVSDADWLDLCDQVRDRYLPGQRPSREMMRQYGFRICGVPVVVQGRRSRDEGWLEL